VQLKRKDYNKIITFFLFIFILGHTLVRAQKEGNIREIAFKPGETISYKIYYHWHFVWLESGEVTFTAAVRNYFNVPCYYLSGCGSTYSKYDWFYKVRDTFQSYLDTNKFNSLRFIRISNEGPTHVTNDNVFDNIRHKVYCLSKNKDNKYHEDTITVPNDAFDVLTGVYYTRCLDYGKCHKGDVIPLELYLDAHIYKINIKYLGKEEVKSSFGTFRCIKFSTNLISGTIFKEGGEMTVWVTDDNNRIPIYIEAPIIVGSVRAELQSFSNLRNPMDAKVK
jgi:hypothetical protein